LRAIVLLKLLMVVELVLQKILIDHIDGHILAIGVQVCAVLLMWLKLGVTRMIGAV
jgi:hypothetical protein